MADRLEKVQCYALTTKMKNVAYGYNQAYTRKVASRGERCTSTAVGFVMWGDRIRYVCDKHLHTKRSPIGYEQKIPEIPMEELPLPLVAVHRDHAEGEVERLRWRKQSAERDLARINEALPKASDELQKLNAMLEEGGPTNA